jgi:hypothetical protein
MHNLKIRAKYESGKGLQSGTKSFTYYDYALVRTGFERLNRRGVVRYGVGLDCATRSIEVYRTWGLGSSFDRRLTAS